MSLPSAKAICEQLLGSVDKESLNQNRLKYGAKGANLLVLQKVLEKLRETKFKNIAKAAYIPEFELVGVDLYIKWSRGEDIQPELQAIYERVKLCGGSIAVRSSAVYSEDGENMTGAGIYDSKFTPEERVPSFEEFSKCVHDVYQSCESERAKQYREENGVKNEVMGLVVQKAVEFGGERVWK